ncbi:MAG: methyl-accepting chemotaxis protein [Ramlibacter sp.]
MFSTIRVRLISTSVLIVIVAVAIVSLVSYRFSRSFILDDLNVQLSGISTSEASKLADWVAGQKRVVKSVAAAALAADPSPALQQALAAGNLDLAYVGSADRKMLSVPSRERPADYDPTARPWYKQAASSAEAIVTAPYIAASSKKLVVTFAYAVKAAGATAAVAGADVTVDDVLAGLSKIHPTPSGYVFLLDKDGRIMAHPNPALVLKPASDLSADITPALLGTVSDAVANPAAVRIGTGHYLLKAAPVPGTEWVLVTAAEEGEALARLNQLLAGIGAVLLVVGGAAAAVSAVSVSALLRGLGRVRDAMLQIGSGSGDLTRRLPVKGRDEIDAIAQAFNDFVDKLEVVMRDVRDSTESIATASSQIAMGAQDLSGRTERTASNLQQTASSMQSITSLVRTSADSAATGESLAQGSVQLADRGGEVVAQVVTTMGEITASSTRISDIISVIDGIAFQTNILALNAAVEAARAGEQGKGFAVVASEVRELSKRTSEAAREIKGLITESVERVEHGGRLVTDAGDSMKRIVDSVRRVTDIVGAITASSVDQSRGLGEINAAVAEVDQMTQQNAALVEESAAAAESLKDQARHLSSVIAQFRISR